MIKMSSLSIGRRIFVGFAFLVFIDVLTSVFAVFNQNVFRDLFLDFNVVSEDATLMLEIDNKVIKLQRQILIYSQARNVSAISQVRELYHHLLSDLESLLESRDDFEDNDKDLLNNMLLSVEQFGENIDLLDEQRVHRDLIEKEFSELYVSTHDAIAQLIVAVESVADNGALALIRQAQMKFSRSEAFGSRYLRKHNFEDKRSATDTLNKAMMFLRQAKALDNKANISLEIASTVDALEVVKTTFAKKMQADRNYIFLVNVVIGGEVATFRNFSDRLSSELVGRQRKLFSNTLSSLNKFQIVAFFSVIFSVFFALIVAVVVGRSISRPIKSITKTFSELAQGVNLKSIPEMDRGDEIGELANAANVFRDTNEKTQELLKQSKILTEDLKVREQALQESNDELDNFAYIASHDLKAPLNAVKNLTQWIQEDCSDILPDESKEHFLMLLNRVSRMENLLADLLRYSRVGRVDVDIETVNIRDVIEDAMTLTDQPKNFVFHIPDNLPDADISVSPLVQVLQNLFTNAINYNDKDSGELWVRVDGALDNDDFMQFTVTDNGPGIDKKYHEKIFVMFQTLQSRDVIESSGMGLAIVRKVVESEGGSIRVESELGKGSSFIFTWPKHASVK